MIKSVIYLVTVDYVDDSMHIKTLCDFVELVDENSGVDVKSTIRLVLGIPIGAPIKVISMCPMLHLQLGD